MYSLDTVLEKTIFELEAISSITRGKRVSTVDGLCLGVLDDTLANSIFRSLYRDNRNRLLPYIEQKVQTAAAFAERILESKYLTAYDGITGPNEDYANMFNKRLEQVDKLLRAIHTVPKGLKSLAETYIDDKHQVYQLRTLSTTINTTIVPPLFLQLKNIREQRTKFVIERELSRKPTVRNPITTPIPVRAAAPSHDELSLSPSETF